MRGVTVSPPLGNFVPKFIQEEDFKKDGRIGLTSIHNGFRGNDQLRAFAHELRTER
ncbi:hypothetical protein HanIR_Chr15g0759881 [Helianthus annuus]|nr:hypothetical protein HanIR_Chr15g0759881 [Helianthus annuus]